MRKIWVSAATAACLLSGQASAVIVTNDHGEFASQGRGTMHFLTLDDLGDTRPLPLAVGPLEVTGSYPTAAYYFSGPQAGHPGEYGDVNGSAWMQMRFYSDTWVTWRSADSFQLIGFDMRPYFDEMGNIDAGETVYYEADTGENGAFTLPTTNDAAFLGLIFTAPVHAVTFSMSIDIDNHATWFGVDNLHLYQTAAAVPEPTSLAMLLCGLGAVGVAASRRKPR